MSEGEGFTRALPVALHGQYMCKCGHKIAGCKCPEHQGDIVRTFNGCVVCKPYPQSTKEKLGVQEKKRNDAKRRN